MSSAHGPSPIHEPVVTHDTPLPPAPPGVRYVRVPWIGVIIADDDLRQHVDGAFHRPMMTLSLLTLPLLAFDLLILRSLPFKQQDPLYVLTWIAILMICAAFFIEYLVKIAIAESRFEYARRHWLDAIIIILPFLRPLRVTYIAKTSRIFTLRGVGMKFLRIVATVVLGLEATNRLLERFGLRAWKDRPAPTAMTRTQLIREVTRLRQRTDAWDQWFDEHVIFLDEQGVRLPASRIIPKDDGTDEQPSIIVDVQATTDLDIEDDDDGVDPRHDGRHGDEHVRRS